MRPPAIFALRVAADRATRDRMTFRNAPGGSLAARPWQPRPDVAPNRGRAAAAGADERGEHE